MALTTNTAYASGTVSSVSGTTFTASSSTFVSGDVGRCIWMANGDARGQTRKIVGYTSGTVVTVDQAWDESPIDNITEDEPSNGDTFRVSWFLDELDDGTNLIKHDDQMYELTDTWNVSNAFVYDINKMLKLDGSDMNFATSACLRLGDKTEDRFSENGCTIFDTNTSLIAWDPGDSGGDFQMYGGVFWGSSANSFWRFQAGNMVRFCDVVQFGNHGMRLSGEKSAVMNYTIVGNEATFSPFTTASPFGEIRNINAFRSDACLYWQSGSPGGATTLRNVRAQDLQEAFFQYRPLSDTKLTLEGISVQEIEDAPIFGEYISGGPSAFEVDVKNNIAVNVFEADTGNTLSGARSYLENDAGTGVLNDTGQIASTSILIRSFDVSSGASTSDLEWDAASGTGFTPMSLKVRKYGYVPFQTVWDGQNVLETFNVYLADDNVVVASEATAGAYTGITVNGSTETITITSDHTLQEIYDYCQWWSVQSGNVQYDVPLTSVDGNTFALPTNWSMILNGGSITSGTGKTLVFGGTGILQMDGETADNVTVAAGDVHLESATNLTGMTIADDLRIDTGANSTLSFTSMDVSGNVWNDDSSHTLTINATNSSLTAGDPGTGNGQTNIVSSVPVTITAVTTLGTPIENARVFLETTPGGVDIFDGSDGTSLTDSNGEVTTSYSGTTPVSVTGRVRKSTSSPFYKTGVISGQITSSGFSATIVMVLDE
jgi:hypothetical protein